MHRGQGNAENFVGCAKRKSIALHRVYHADTLRAVGNIDRCIQIVEEDTNDFAETQGDDGKVVTAKPQGRGSQQYPEAAGQQRAERQHRPHRPVQAKLR